MSNRRTVHSLVKLDGSGEQCTFTAWIKPSNTLAKADDIVADASKHFETSLNESSLPRETQDTMREMLKLRLRCNSVKNGENPETWKKSLYEAQGALIHDCIGGEIPVPGVTAANKERMAEKIKNIFASTRQMLSSQQEGRAFN